MTTSPNGIRIHQPRTNDTAPEPHRNTTTVIPSTTDTVTTPITNNRPQQTNTAKMQRKPHKPWPLLIIGAAAAVGVWSGWVGLGQMAGFGVIHPLPGIWDDLQVNTAFVLPLSVEAYAAYALRVWLGVGNGPRSARTQRFAKTSAIASLVIGAIAQVAYHLMDAAGYTRAPWPIVMLVATVPVIVLGLASALAKLVTTDTSERS